MDTNSDQPERRADGVPEVEQTIPRRALPPEDLEASPDGQSYPHYPGPPPNTEETRITQPVAPRLLGGRYELGEVIGRGGMAEVRQAYDTRLGRNVAVKELRADLASDPTFQARFRREAQSAAGLNHPNIVAVYDTGESTDEISGLAIPFIVMELVEGHTLRDVLKDGRKILPERALELARGVLDALSYSHKSGIIHRDIKPANVMLTPQGNVKVMDFGIARAISETATSMTQTAAVIGTAQYLSPEQARGETVDARSDIYSAGCLLYELLVGRPPFIGDSPVSVAYQHVREMPVPPSQLDPVISHDIDKIVLTALAKDPHDRYQSARAMSDDINRLLAGEQIHAVAPVPMSEPSPPTRMVSTMLPTTVDEPEYEEEPRKSRLPVVLVVLGSILALLLGAGVFWFLNSDRQPAPPQPVAVPNVVGKQRAEAEAEITRAQLVPEVSEVEGADDHTIGTVTDQNPAYPATLDPGRTVRLEVNIGPRKASIPGGLINKRADEARRALHDAGFTNVQTRPAATEPPEATRDQVLGVEPGEGSEVALATTITLEVATGESVVPDWRELNQAGVERDARSLGFRNVIFETQETEDPGQVGIVIATTPTAGTRISRTDRITVIIGRAAPAPSPTPEPTTTRPTPSPTPSPTPTPTPLQPQ